MKKSSKWLRYTYTIIIHLCIVILFIWMSIMCLFAGITGGVVFFLVMAAAYTGSFIFMLRRIRKEGPSAHKEKDTGKRIVAVSMVTLFVLAFIVPFGASVYLYEDNFDARFETYEPLSRSIEEFDGLQVSECTFPSDQGQNLAGYIYFKEGIVPKGVVVIAHGLGGGGHNSYMDAADYFASNGYLVFAYDATGNDKSEGDSVRGLAQGVVDLDYALRYVKADERMKNMPIVLFGHSWGGYAAANVLNLHPDVKAVVTISGFNRSIDLIESQGKQMIGNAVQLITPYVMFYEGIKFGGVSAYTAMDGFANSDAGVMVIHSSDDDTVPAMYGYDIYYAKYSNDDRFHFIRYEDRGHNYIYYTDAARSYIDEFNAEYHAYFSAFEEVTAEEKADYLHENVDKARLFELDSDLFGEILEFYDASVAR